MTSEEDMSQTTTGANQYGQEEIPEAWQKVPHRKKGGRGNKAERNYQQEINFQTNQLDDTISHNRELQADLKEEEEGVKKLTYEIKIQEYDNKKVKQRDKQGAALQQSLPQIENQEKVFKEKMEEEVCRLNEQIDVKKKELNRANKRASRHGDTFCRLGQAQSAVEATRSQCHALEEEQRCQLVQRDQRHLQELSQREAAHRKKLSEQEARFRKEGAELTGGFEQRLGEHDGTAALRGRGVLQEAGEAD